MSRTLRAFLVTTVLSCGAIIGPGAFAATASVYDPVRAFAPIDLPGPVNAYRSSNGAPGPSYWQNRADYDIHATLDTSTKQIHASETITYTNNSPDVLATLWVQLDQNTYRRDARGTLSNDHRRHAEFTDGYAIDSVEVERDGQRVKADWLVSDTRMQVTLPEALKGAGGKIKLHVSYHYTVPGLFGGRTAWMATPKGEIYDIAQWYPRMAVYDDVRGWDPLPYLAQEFYLEYGDFDYAVTVPADMLVAGTGLLTNADEVLTPLQRQRLAQAHASDSTVMIRTPEEVGSGPAAFGTKTWRYHMSNTRDVAFSASRAFVWDAARINLPDGKTALAESFYPVESVGPGNWGRSTEYLKDSVEHFSKRWYPYPYPAAINIAGGATGMEYPGMAFDGIDDKGKTLFWITAHEIGHTWFPMTVGFDERRDAWMDEGFNTFIDTFESDDFANGVYGPKRDSEYAPGGGNPVDEILPILADPDAPPILTRADSIQEKYRHPVTYFKSALGLRLLRDQILGPERFDPAFRKFIRDWAFRHPKPSDFFRAMSSETGEDLSWWWRGWYFNNWTLDLAVTGVRYEGGDPAKGAHVTLANLDRLIMPATLEVKFQDGRTQRIAVPAETWIQRGDAIVSLDSTTAITSVTIDPDHVLPDKDRSNNVFKPAAVGKVGG
ncbi:M1 family metallopeptidase [Caulobacter sp. S45]|uniref:M1 family metallopeptidase n=1 Tax=Caulobacter sp. S45 TaxID=1641861 RepID=UPI00131D4967|nr:M1 family metallopeptidase [Caulobacter sp. S45]